VSGINPVGRPAVAIDPGSPFARFALELRGLREAARLNLRLLADLSGFSASVLSEATNGRSLPALDVTLAYVRSCGGDPVLWAERWFELTAAQRSASAGEAGEGDPTDPGLEADVGGPVHQEPSAWPSPEGMEARPDVSCRVSTASGEVIRLSAGSRLVFGRGPSVDLTIGAGRATGDRTPALTRGS
jgi:transcriptional regulator with XRE-family HTH domain